MASVDLNTTLLALRITAFVSSTCFALAYASSQRRFWIGFVVFHTIHLGFIHWYLVALSQPIGTFDLYSGVAAYVLIFWLAALDIVRPGRALEVAWGLHFIWLNLAAMFGRMIVEHFSDGFRIHSALGLAMLLTAAKIRFLDRGGRARHVPMQLPE